MKIIVIALALLTAAVTAYAAPPLQNSPELERYFDLCMSHRNFKASRDPATGNFPWSWSECSKLVAAWWTADRDMTTNPGANAICGRQCWGVKQYPRNRQPGNDALDRQALDDFMAREGIQ